MSWLFNQYFYRRRIQTDVRLNEFVVITCNLWDLVQYGMWWAGDNYEVHQTRYFKSVIHSGAVVFDIGANVGFYSLVAAPLAGPTGTVYCFEPMTQQFERLTQNISRNKLARVFPQKLALSDRAGEAVIHLTTPNNTGSASLLPASSARGSEFEERVRCSTLDEFVATHELKRLDVMKIDVEGLELKVLQGGTSTIQRFRPTILIEVTQSLQERAGASRQQVYHWMGEQGYQAFRIQSGATLQRIDVPEDGELIAFLPQ